MLKELFFLCDDELLIFCVRFLCSFLHGSRELYYVYVYLVGKYVSSLKTPPAWLYVYYVTVLTSITTLPSNCQPFFIRQSRTLKKWLACLFFVIHSSNTILVMELCTEFFKIFLCTGLIDKFFTYQSLWIKVSSTSVGSVDKALKSL